MARKTTIALPVSLKPIHWKAPDSDTRGRFRANGRLQVPKRSQFLTPNWRSSEPTWAARLFVGFSVGETPTYEMDDLIQIVRRVRNAQGVAEDSSYVFQRGVYTHEDGSGTVQEDGAQVILLNLDPGVTKQQFEKQMIELANVLVDEMEQETVIVEMQRGGIVQEVIGVTRTDTEQEVDLL